MTPDEIATAMRYVEGKWPNQTMTAETLDVWRRSLVAVTDLPTLIDTIGDWRGQWRPGVEQIVEAYRTRKHPGGQAGQPLPPLPDLPDEAERRRALQHIAELRQQVAAHRQPASEGTP